MAKKINYFYPNIFLLILFLVLFVVGACSSIGEVNTEKNIVQPTVALPPLERIIPNDPYLFLPLEYVAFQLNFTEGVDPDVLEKAISFEPELDFQVRSSNHNPEEVYLDPQEKLRSDTIYTLQIRGIQNKSSGKTETLKFAYRTEFQGDKEIINPQWSHDGEEIAYLVRQEKSDTAELWKVSMKNGNKQLLADGVGWPGSICWSPDDSLILFAKMIPKSEKIFLPEICTVDREGKEEKVIIPAAELEGIVEFGPVNAYAWWSPEGKNIALQLDLGGVDAHSDMIRSLAIVDSDGRNLRPVGGQIFVGWQDKSRLMVLKTHQNYNYGHAYRYDLFLVEVDKKQPGRLLLGEGQIPNFDRVSQSPDLNTLVIGQWKSLNAVTSFKSEGTGILLYDVAQKSLIPLELAGGYQKHPTISPEGKRIVFADNKAGNWDLYLWQNGTIKQLTKDSGHELYPSWSPQRDLLAFVSRNNGTEEICLLQLSSGKVEYLGIAN